jgi:sulfoxide reductase heme-binding subunit YedZ
MNSFAQALVSFEKSAPFTTFYNRYTALYPSVKKFWIWLWVAIVAFGVFGTLVYFVEPRTYVEVWFAAGRKFGSLAALLYVATLIPGMLKRFDVLPLTRAGFKLPRRQVGVTVFLLALVHQWLVRFIPVILETGSVFPITWHVGAGMLSLTLLFPLWLTSNDLSVKKLGKWWDIIHALTYVAMFTIMLHVALAGERSIALIVLIAILVELASWIFSRARKR